MFSVSSWFAARGCFVVIVHDCFVVCLRLVCMVHVHVCLQIDGIALSSTDDVIVVRNDSICNTSWMSDAAVQLSGGWMQHVSGGHDELTVSTVRVSVPWTYRVCLRPSGVDSPFLEVPGSLVVLC